MGKRLPHAMRRQMDGVFSGPVLDRVVRGVRRGPIDPQAIDLLNLRQGENNPLRVQLIAFSGKRFAEIWIALPITVQIPIGKTRIACVTSPVIPSEPAMRQSV